MNYWVFVRNCLGFVAFLNYASLFFKKKFKKVATFWSLYDAMHMHYDRKFTRSTRYTCTQSNGQ